MSSRRVLWVLSLLLIVCGLLLVYRGTEKQAPAVPLGATLQIARPLGLPPVPVPADNPPTATTIALGRQLYYDPVLSVDNSVSCATCHHPDYGFADGKSLSDGVRAQKGARNSPTVLNTAYFNMFFWDGRAATLEEQAAGPVQNPVEMGHTLKGVENKLMRYPAYREAFAKAFESGHITFDMVAKAIASFERTLVSGNSPFDRYYYGHEENALSESAKRGLIVFTRSDKGNCAACHEIGKDYALFTDKKFHNVGVGVHNEQPTDLGRYAVTRSDADQGAFRTPSLRNIARTAPYMHDGSLKTLKDVVDFYIGAGNSNPYLDKRIKPLDFLTGQERADLLAFLESLTGEIPPNAGEPQNRASAARLLSP
ncbi:MAG TPA: cytochrome c peroxidase [Terriglobales bacterium]|nr:cytochrome c peroxidase [Terriglobales bacterium]